MVDNRLLQRVPVYKSAPEDPIGPDDNALLTASPEPRLIDTILQALAPKYESTRGQRNRSAVVNEVEDTFTRDRPGQPRFQLWPERMVRSAVTLPGDVLSGNVPPPGLRREDYTDVPVDPDKVGGQPHDDLIQRVQDLAGLAMTGGLAGTGQGGMVVGSGATMPSHTPHLRVAAKIGDKVYEGQPGEIHAQMLERFPEIERQVRNEMDLDSAMGFLDKDGKFLNRGEAAREYAKLDKSYDLEEDPHLITDYAPMLWAKNEAAAPLSSLERRAPTWYSPVEHALEATTNARATGAQWLATLKNSRGVKPEELDWTGLRAFLEERAEQSVSRPELHEYLRDNRVELQDVTKGGDSYREDIGDPTKYHSYQLPGGENYREHLITMPIRSDLEKLRGFAENRGVSNIAEAQRLYQEKYGELPRGSDNYKSSHWDEPNIVAHVRSNVREMPRDPVEQAALLTPERVTRAAEYSGMTQEQFLSMPVEDKLALALNPGERYHRSLHLEEVQSDWHQAGRRKGYKLDEAEVTERRKLQDRWIEEGDKLPDADKRRLNELMAREKGGEVPDAPWKKTWHELALRRMIRLAAEEGMDRISWTPGEAQAARYSLEKHVQALDLTHNRDGLGELLVYPKDGGVQRVPTKSKDDLVNTVGKEYADKLYAMGKENNGRAKLEGVELKIGGEGMRGFYDKMMVQAAEKLGKEYGVKVVRGKIGPDASYELKAPSGGRKQWAIERDGNVVDGYASKAEAEEALRQLGPGGQPIWYFDIPPAMREAVLSKGMPLFSGGKMFVPSGAQRSESDGRD